MTSSKAHANHKDVLPALERVGGQIAEVIQAVEAEYYCIDILNRLRTVRSALKAVEDRVLGEHVEHCVAAAAASGDVGEHERKVAEILAAIGGDDGSSDA